MTLTQENILTISLFLIGHLLIIGVTGFKFFRRIDLAVAKALQQVASTAEALIAHEQRDAEREDRVYESLNKFIEYNDIRHKHALETINQQHRVAMDGIQATNASSRERFDLTMKAIDKLAGGVDASVARLHSDIADVRRRQA